MTPHCAKEKLLLERRIQFIRLTDVLFHINEPQDGEYLSYTRWFLDEEFFDVNTREALIDSLKGIEASKQNDQVSADESSTDGALQ